MKNIKAVLIGTLILGGLEILWAEQTAKLEIIAGKVQVMRAGVTTWEPVERRQEAMLKQGDRVRTAPGSRARITLQDSSKIELSPSSLFTVDFADEQSNFKFKLDMGTLRAIISKLQISRKVTVVTPTAVCAVRGTEFSMSFNEAGQDSLVRVFEGQVSVSNSQQTSEVFVGAGQEVQVTPEGIGPLQTGGSNQLSKDAGAVSKEVRFQLSREAIEAGAALEMKNAVAQDGKTVIDAFGLRVRTESYIARSDADRRLSWVALNDREGDDLSFSRWDIWTNQDLPSSFNSGFLAGLYFKSGSDAPSAWATKDQWFMSNGSDFWTRAQQGGNPVKFSNTTTGDVWWEAIFDNRYTAISDAGGTRLLEHFIPAAGVKGTDLTGGFYACNTGGFNSCANSNSPAFGNSPDYFYDYYAAGGGSAVGDQGEQKQSVAPVSDFLKIHEFAGTLHATYAAKEGYFNNWVKKLDGQPTNCAACPSETSVTDPGARIHETVENNYGTVTSITAGGAPEGFLAATLAGDASLTVTYDDYIIQDDGSIYKLGDLGNSDFKNFAEKANFEFVTQSPTFANKLDLVIPMRILNALDASSSRPAS